MHTDSTAILLAFAMLLFAAIDDVRRRRVDNRWWIPFIGAAVVLDAGLLLEHGMGGPEALRLGLAVLACGLFYVMWWLRLFGGADAKGLMVLSLLIPIAGPAGTIPALDVLANGLLVTLVIPVAFALWNVANGRVALPAMFLGVPRATVDASRIRWSPLQVPDETGLRWARMKRPADAWDQLDAARIERVWMTPRLPFMVSIFAGFSLYLGVGNVMLWLLQL